MMPRYLISLYLGLLNGLFLGFGVVSFVLISIVAAGFASSPESMVVIGFGAGVFVFLVFLIFCWSAFVV